MKCAQWPKELRLSSWSLPRVTNGRRRHAAITMETNPTKQVMERNRTPGIELWNRVTQNQEPLDGYGGGLVLKKGGRERGIMGFVG